MATLILRYRKLRYISETEVGRIWNFGPLILGPSEAKKFGLPKFYNITK
jgi:hypothetical protein